MTTPSPQRNYESPELCRDPVKGNGKHRDRRGETLFIDARKMGTLTDRTHRDLSEEEISRISGTYHAWRGKQEPEASARVSSYADIPGFCKTAKTAEIEQHGFVLTPGRYVGAEDVEDDGEPFGEKMKQLTAKLHEQFEESTNLQRSIAQTLAGFTESTQ